MNLHLNSWWNSTIGSQMECSFHGTRPQLFQVQWRSSPSYARKRNIHNFQSDRHARYKTIFIFRHPSVTSGHSHVHTKYISCAQASSYVYVSGNPAIRTPHRSRWKNWLQHRGAFRYISYPMACIRLRDITPRQAPSELYGWQGWLNNWWHSIHLVPKDLSIGKIRRIITRITLRSW